VGGDVGTLWLWEITLTSSTDVVCGDGFRQSGEACDDGSNDGVIGCALGCTGI